MHGTAIIKIYRGRQQRIVRTWHQYFMARRKQPAQHHVYQFADAISYVDVIDVHALRTPLSLLHDDGIARRKKTLLMAIWLARVQILNQCQTKLLAMEYIE